MAKTHTTHKTPHNEQGSTPARPRRPYTAPKLVEYGSVSRLTQGMSSSKRADAGSGMRFDK